MNSKLDFNFSFVLTWKKTEKIPVDVKSKQLLSLFEIVAKTFTTTWIDFLLCWLKNDYLLVSAQKRIRDLVDNDYFKNVMDSRKTWFRVSHEECNWRLFLYDIYNFLQSSLICNFSFTWHVNTWTWLCTFLQFSCDSFGFIMRCLICSRVWETRVKRRWHK